MSASSDSGTPSFSPNALWIAVIALAAIFGFGRPATETPPAPAAPKTPTKTAEATAPAGDDVSLACGSDALGSLGWFFGLCNPRPTPNAPNSVCIYVSPAETKSFPCPPRSPRTDPADRLRLLEKLKSSLRRRVIPQIDFVVLLLPDPHYRAIGTLTDSFLDAYALGLGQRSFMPFLNRPSGWPALQSQAENPGAASLPSPSPGIWIFSKSVAGELTNLTVTLLVGENPVTGVDQHQLKLAFNQIESLRQPLELSAPRYFLIGPTFSGSARSLADTLVSSEHSFHLKAASATASNPGLDTILNSPKLTWRTDAVIDPACVAIQDIRRSFGSTEKIMLLREGNTAYGLAGPQRECAADFSSNLPGDLAVLRKAYSEHKPLYARIFPSSESGPATLPIPLHTSQGEGVAIYSGETLAKSQETSLFTLAQKLKTERIRFLGIITTDRLDSLFLARFFREHSPNAQIFIVGSDVLFSAESARGLLSGVLTYSSAPIGIATPYEHLGSDDLSTQLRLTVDNLLAEKVPPPARLYASIIGRGGEWPLRDLPPDSRPDSRAVGHWGVAAAFWLTISILFGLPAFRFLLSRYPIRRLAPLANRLRAICPYAHWVNPSNAVGDGDQEPANRENKRVHWLWAYTAAWLVLSLGLLAGLVYAFALHDSLFMSRYRVFLNGVNPVIPLLCFVLIALSFARMRIRARYLDNYTFHVLPAKHMIAPKEIQDDLISANQEGFCVRWAAFSVVAALLLSKSYGLLPRDVEANPPLLDSFLWSSLALLSYVIVLYSLIHFWRLWRFLLRLLIALESHPIRNAFTRLPERVSWTSVWSFIGLTPGFVSLQLATDYLNVFRHLKPGPLTQPESQLLEKSKSVLDQAKIGAIPDSPAPTAKDAQTKARPASGVREDLSRIIKLSSALGERLSLALDPIWNESALEGWRGARLDWPGQTGAKDHYTLGHIGPARNPEALKRWDDDKRLMEEYIASLFCSYIRYVFAQLRNLAGCIATCASLLFLAFSSYPFQPHGALINAVTFLFVLFAVILVVVFQQMDRDAILSRLSDTSAGKLDAGFTTRLLQFGLLPSLTFLAGLVPGMSDLLLGIVEFIPGLPK